MIPRDMRKDAKVRREHRSLESFDDPAELLPPYVQLDWERDVQ